ncbi:MAG: protein BatD [Bacteroidetes bacterium]|nr:protein BatD [Bacteroidota bacterium]
MRTSTSHIKQLKPSLLKGLAVVLILFIAVFNCQLLTAQARFSAAAPKTVPENQSFQLSYTLENANGTNLRPPSFNDFQLVGGPNTSTSMQFINGSVSQSVTYSYILRPKKQGTYKIGKASINVEGVNMESNEVSVEISAPSSQQQSQQRQRNPFDPFGDPFFNQQQEPEPQTSNEDLSKQLKDDIFLKVVVSKSSLYKGEMLTASYKLYFRQNLSGYNLSKAPTFDGFWSQEVELDPKRTPSVETINGKQFNTVEVLKYNLYPQRAGSLQIAPAELSTVAQVAVRSHSRNAFDDFFNMGRAQNVPLNLKTAATSISVKDLPDSGKPADFAGAVGKMNFQTSLSSKEAKTDEPITYTVKISGTGNLKLVDAPTVQLPNGFEVYEPKVKENISNGAAGMSGTKQYDYLIVPRQPGDYKIESQVFSYFDPSTGKYHSIASPEYALKITGEASKNPNTGISASVSKQDVSLLGQDIIYIKTKLPEFNKSGKSFFGSAGFMALYSAPFLLFIGLIVLKRRSDSLSADLVGAKRRRALKLAKKRLSLADKHLKQNDRKSFYDEVSRAIWGYLGDKLSIDMSELSKDNVADKLSARSAKIETVVKLQQLISTCELALYASSGGDGEMKHHYDSALNLIADLEDEIKA